MDDTELADTTLVKAWARWALVWLTVFPLVGVLVSIQFHNPEFLGGTSWLSFGRLRPVHTNGVIFGSFTTAFIGLLYYFVPRLCGTPLYKAEWGWGLLWMWNAFLIVGSLSLLMGYVIGVENGIYWSKCPNQVWSGGTKAVADSLRQLGQIPYPKAKGPL